MHKNTVFFTLGVNKQENTQVHSKCMLMMDPDTHIRGDPLILECFLPCAFGVIQVKMTGSSLAHFL